MRERFIFSSKIHHINKEGLVLIKMVPRTVGVFTWLITDLYQRKYWLYYTNFWDMLFIRFHITGWPTKKCTFFRCIFLEPLISLKKCSIFKRNIFISVFIITRSQISRLEVARDIQRNRKFLPRFLCNVLNF